LQAASEIVLIAIPTWSTTDTGGMFKPLSSLTSDLSKQVTAFELTYSARSG
jgi:hypothetical protein